MPLFKSAIYFIYPFSCKFLIFGSSLTPRGRKKYFFRKVNLKNCLGNCAAQSAWLP